MGLLDWLTEGIGSDMGGGGLPPGMFPGGGSMEPPSVPMNTDIGSAGGGALPPGMYPGGGRIPMPPVQQTGPDGPPLVDPATQAMPGGQGAGPPAPNPLTDAMPGGQGGPAPASIPLPQQRPAGAPGQPPTDVSAASQPPGPPTSLLPPGGGQPPQQPPAQGGFGMEQAASQGILSRALGLSPNTSNRLRGSLAAGLKSVGENYTKPGLAAASGSAGAAMEGGQKREDTTYDQKMKALTQAVAAKSRGDEAAYKTGYLKYLGQKLKSDQEAAASGGGKSGAWNKPDSQKFVDAMNAMNKDRRIVASQKALEQAIRDGDQKRIAQLQGVHDQLTNQVRGEYLTGVGLDPKQIEANMKNPPGSQANPFKVNSQADFDRYVKPGQAYLNPKDGKVYIRNGEGGGAQEGGTSSATPNVKPEPMNPMKPGNGTNSDEKEED